MVETSCFDLVCGFDLRSCFWVFMLSNALRSMKPMCDCVVCMGMRLLFGQIASSLMLSSNTNTCNTALYYTHMDWWRKCCVRMTTRICGSMALRFGVSLNVQLWELGIRNIHATIPSSSHINCVFVNGIGVWFATGINRSEPYIYMCDESKFRVYSGPI